jgi:hypothetical protein
MEHDAASAAATAVRDGCSDWGLLASVEYWHSNDGG